MWFKRPAHLLAFAILPVLAAACAGGGGGPGPTETAGPTAPSTGTPAATTPTLADITEGDPASILPTAQEVAAAMPSLAPIQPNYFEGRRTNQDVIDTAIDPEQAEQDVDQFKRVTGYEGSYTPQGREAEILVQLALFESAEGASGWLGARANVGELEQLYGPDAAIEQFDASGIGDEAVGITGVLNVPVTGVLVRVRNITAFVQVALAQGDVTGEVKALARTVAAKIDAALAG
ncbi:MAG: hypothetical protein HYS09_07365 [Chloroflexi bacterium]|nr:hypothetical protein [Chloroflexota bacterium]